MLLLGARIVGLAPFGDLLLPLSEDDGTARLLTVIHGGGGMGKTTLLAALAATRPGCAVVPSSVHPLQPSPYVVCDWHLGMDDAGRPHPLRIATPTVKLDGDEAREALRRREQAHFEKAASAGGFAFLSLPSARWFSRQPLTLSAPQRSIARYDVRAMPAVDDATRSDLTRETKQALAYARLAAALRTARDAGPAFELLDAAMTSAVGSLVGLLGYTYEGLDTVSFEPTFGDPDGGVQVFDALPQRVRHLAALGALPVRTLWAAYPGHDPRTCEGVFCVDEIEAHQDGPVRTVLASTLRRILPRAQWILTTTSARVAASVEAREVLALRPSTDGALPIEVHHGTLARLH